MMERLVDRMIKLEGNAPFLDRAVLTVGVFSLVMSLTGTILIYA